MELEDAIHTALLTLKEGFEGEARGWVVGLGGRRLRGEQQDQQQAWGQQAIGKRHLQRLVRALRS